MSLYRFAVQNGMLVRQKRKLLRFWMWAYNRCEEDHVTRMKNRLTAIRAEEAALLKMIPEHEERVKKMKEKLNDTGGVGVPFRDSFSFRREPVRLNRDVKVPKPKPKNDGNKPKPPKPLMSIMPGDGK